MDFAGSFLQGLTTLIAYALLLAGVYKIFQVATALDEIKELLKGRQPMKSGPISEPMAEASVDLDADEYAEKLLRSVHDQARNPSVSADAR